ncbi:aspartyl-phosphate phosphatase Spo0E family protein [Brevibacillus fulvus]|uniref:Spo0E like sporulation regulatory protein n=1 Tax=Brevibacillus fulvus TaxID=1125967 RepID=A0A939BN86_9BACL|nr:aspartyl-phosphate phosphatase Spo0E family protein [Brevibacillus fulvus]MBM7588600.1 hypothetical protein [Brevibacillus fulvus]
MPKEEDPQDLLKLIDFHKKYLIVLAKERKLSHPTVLIVSQYLDKLLNRYNQQKS